MSIAARIGGAVQRRRRRFQYEVRRPEMTLSEVYAALAPGGGVDLLVPDGFQRLWAAHLASTPASLWSVTPSPAPEAIDRARRGEARLLSRTITVPAQADWHADLFHAVRWPKVHIDSCPFRVPGGDLVLLWHLNRMSFLDDFIAAYRASGEDEIAQRVVALMDSWAKGNPYLVGANWLSPMETGLRLLSWSTALAGLGSAPVPDARRCERILRSVLRQAEFLAAHFSRWPIPNNHLIGEAATLAAVAAYWPVFKRSAIWMVQADSTMLDEAKRQVLKDGFDFENSVNYHLVVLDYFLLYLHAKLLRGESPHETIIERTHALADAALSLVAPSGRMPMIGDDSMPHFVVINGTMGSPGPVSGQVNFEDFVRLPHARLFSTTPWGRDLLTLHKPVVAARRFHEAGIDVARDEHSHIVFTHGPQHRHPYSHGHLHADAGSFELELDGAPLVVDSGTYLYDGEKVRNHMRSARAHNTVVIDGVEPMKPVSPFQWESVAIAEPLGFGVEGDVMVTGCRRKLPGLQEKGVEHARVLVRVGSTIIIADVLTPSDAMTGTAQTAAIYFHTTVAAGIAVHEGHRVRLTDESRFTRVFEVLDEPGATIDLLDDPADYASQYSTEYGEVTHGTTIRVSVPVTPATVLVSVLRVPEVEVTRVPTRAGEIGCAIVEGHSRRLVSVRLDPFAVHVSGRRISGANSAPAPVRAPDAPDSMAWLDELDA